MARQKSPSLGAKGRRKITDLIRIYLDASSEEQRQAAAGELIYFISNHRLTWLHGLVRKRIFRKMTREEVVDISQDMLSELYITLVQGTTFDLRSPDGIYKLFYRLIFSQICRRFRKRGKRSVAYNSSAVIDTAVLIAPADADSPVIKAYRSAKLSDYQREVFENDVLFDFVTKTRNYWILLLEYLLTTFRERLPPEFRTIESLKVQVNEARRIVIQTLAERGLLHPDSAGFVSVRAT